MKAQSWSLTGNAGTNSFSNIIGTMDNNIFNFRVSNRISGTIDSASKSTFFGFGAFSSGVPESLSFNTGFGHLVIVHKLGGDNTGMGAFALNANTDGTCNTANAYRSSPNFDSSNQDIKKPYNYPVHCRYPYSKNFITEKTIPAFG